MTTENYISLFSAVLLAISVLYLAKQVKIARKTHSENHEWFRRIETRKALDSYNRLEAVAKLDEAFNYLRARQPIALQEVQEKLENSSELRVNLLRLLNFYEGLANGIDLGIYDEVIIRETRRGNMMRAHIAFEAYMDFHRNDRNPRAYIKYRALIQKWQAEGEHGVKLQKLGQR